MLLLPSAAALNGAVLQRIIGSRDTLFKFLGFESLLPHTCTGLRFSAGFATNTRQYH